MDDPQNLASVANARIGRSGGGSAGNNESGDGQSRYWCYQCNEEVLVVREEGGLEDRSSGVVCAECRNGFVEILTTAEPDLQRRLRRRRLPRGASRAQMVELSETLEQLHPHQLMQLMQLLTEATGSNNTISPVADENHAIDEADENITVGHNLSQQDQPVQRSPTISGEGGVIQIEDSSTLPTEADAEIHNPSNESSVRQVAFLRQRFQRQTGDENDDGEDDDEDGDDDIDEEGLQLELQGWHSGTDDDNPEEWEEVDNGGDEVEDANEEVNFSQTQQGLNVHLDRGATVVINDGAAAEDSARQPEGPPNRQPRHRLGLREHQTLPARARNAEQNLHQYLLELLQNMVRQNVEVSVEFPDGPMYVGNPGDYVDATEFEQLLQQLAENDSSQQGAPPAAKSAVDALLSVRIEQFHLVQGTAVCAICKDTVSLDEYAKQLPCNHLYHHDCILPWLNSRNSCPVCRYELPTDDPDYEEQKQKRDTVRSSLTRTCDQRSEEMSNFAEHAQENSREGNEEASDIVVDRSGSNMERLESCNTENPMIEEDPEIEQSNDDFNASSLVDSHSTVQGIRRGWLSLAAGPLLSMAGLVLVICLSSHVIGGGMQPNGRDIRLQQSNFCRETQIDQVGVSSEVQNQRHWWIPFLR